MFFSKANRFQVLVSKHVAIVVHIKLEQCSSATTIIPKLPSVMRNRLKIKMSEENVALGEYSFDWNIVSITIHRSRLDKCIFRTLNMHIA